MFDAAFEFAALRDAWGNRRATFGTLRDAAKRGQRNCGVLARNFCSLTRWPHDGIRAVPLLVDHFNRALAACGGHGALNLRLCFWQSPGRNVIGSFSCTMEK